MLMRRGTVEQRLSPAGLKSCKHWSGEDLSMVLETGCTYLVGGGRTCARLGLSRVVIDARRFKMIADSKKKSDRHDARALADGLRGGLAQRIAVSVPRERARRGQVLDADPAAYSQAAQHDHKLGEGPSALGWVWK
jgi:hypothetical protein